MGRLTGNCYGEAFVEVGTVNEVDIQDPTSKEYFTIYKGEAIDKLADYENIIDDPEKLKLIDKFYQERCEEINRLNKIINALATKLLNTEFGGCYMCKNPMKNITIDDVNNGCDGECNLSEESTVEEFLKKFIAELERMRCKCGEN